MTFERISVDSAVMGGAPCIRGTRIPVATIVAMLADGMERAEILRDFPQLTEADLREALRFAAAAVERQSPTMPASA